MAAAEVVMGEMQGDSRAVVFQLFTEPVRQTGEPAHGHAERQILAFHMGSADLRRVGIAADWDHLNADDFGGAVPFLAFARGIKHTQIAHYQGVQRRIIVLQPTGCAANQTAQINRSRATRELGSPCRRVSASNIDAFCRCWRAQLAR